MFNQSGLSLADQIKNGLLALGNNPLKTRQSVGGILDAARQKMINSGFSQPYRATDQYTQQSGANDPYLAKEAGMGALKILQTANSDQEAGNLYQGMRASLAQKYPNAQLPEYMDRNTLKQLANNYMQVSAADPGQYDYNPAVADMQRQAQQIAATEQQQQKTPQDILQGLLASDKGGALKGALPMLIKSGLLSGNNAQAGNIDAAVGVKLNEGGPRGLLDVGGQDLSGFLEGFQPTGDFATDSAMLKSYLENKKAIKDLNAPPEGFTLSEGQARFDAQGNPIAGLPQGQKFSSAPFEGINKDGKPSMFAKDEGGNVIDLGISPILKKGMSITTNEDGTFSFEMGGDNMGAEGFAPTKQTLNKIQSNLIDLSQQRIKFGQVIDNYKKSYLTYYGGLRGWTGEKLEKITGAQPDKEFLQGQVKFKNATEQLFNQYRKEITGAAASVQELDRLKTSMLNTDQSPSQFEASAQLFYDYLSKIEYSYNNTIAKGFNPGSKEFAKALDDEVFNLGGNSQVYDPNQQSGNSQQNTAQASVPNQGQNQYSQEDLEYTARIHGMSVDDVKRQLGQR